MAFILPTPPRRTGERRAQWRLAGTIVKAQLTVDVAEVRAHDKPSVDDRVVSGSPAA